MKNKNKWKWIQRLMSMGVIAGNSWWIYGQSSKWVLVATVAITGIASYIFGRYDKARGY
jgi:hypothetical protein